MLLQRYFFLFSTSALAANSPLGDLEPIRSFLWLRLITSPIFKLSYAIQTAHMPVSESPVNHRNLRAGASFNKSVTAVLKVKRQKTTSGRSLLRLPHLIKFPNITCSSCQPNGKMSSNMAPEKQAGTALFFSSVGQTSRTSICHIEEGNLRNVDACCLLTFRIKGFKELDSTNCA